MAAFHVPVIPTAAIPTAPSPSPGVASLSLRDDGASSSTSASSSLREPKQLRDWLGEITELLLTGGYFRARIPSLPPFDKIIGGLAWSITASNVDVDLDLFYDEDIKMGWGWHSLPGVRLVARRKRSAASKYALHVTWRGP